MKLVKHLSLHAPGTGKWEEIGEHQAVCPHGPRTKAYVLRVGSSWGWLIAIGGEVVAGKIDWNMAPEDAAREAFDMIEVSSDAHD